MKLEEYKSGEYIKMNDYKAFIPSKINYNWGWDDTKLDKLLAEANRQIGELNAYSLLIPNVDLYIKMHVKIEANKSSRIEGTRTTVEEDLLDVTDINPEKRDDWEEVQNYVKATNYGVERIKEGFPVCTRLIREIHGILMQGVRKGMLEKSCLYISDYIERNKNTYYDMLTRVRTHNDMIGWIKFFLEAVIETSKTAKEKFRSVVELTMEMDKVIMELPVKSENARKVLDVLYNEPVVSRKKIIENTGMKFTTLVGVINAFLEKEILVETTGFSRNQIFAFQKYIDLFLK